MVQVRDEWYYFDHDGALYRLRPSYYYELGSPFLIELVRR